MGYVNPPFYALPEGVTVGLLVTIPLFVHAINCT